MFWCGFASLHSILVGKKKTTLRERKEVKLIVELMQTNRLRNYVRNLCFQIAVLIPVHSNLPPFLES